MTVLDSHYAVWFSTKMLFWNWPRAYVNSLLVQSHFTEMLPWLLDEWNINKHAFICVKSPGNESLCFLYITQWFQVKEISLIHRSRLFIYLHKNIVMNIRFHYYQYIPLNPTSCSFQWAPIARLLMCPLILTLFLNGWSGGREDKRGECDIALPAQSSVSHFTRR